MSRHRLQATATIIRRTYTLPNMIALLLTFVQIQDSNPKFDGDRQVLLVMIGKQRLSMLLQQDEAR